MRVLNIPKQPGWKHGCWCLGAFPRGSVSTSSAFPMWINERKWHVHDDQEMMSNETVRSSNIFSPVRHQAVILFSEKYRPFSPGLNIGMAIHTVYSNLSKTKVHYQIHGFAGHLNGINMEVSRQVCKSYFLLCSRRNNFPPSCIAWCEYMGVWRLVLSE